MKEQASHPWDCTAYTYACTLSLIDQCSDLLVNAVIAEGDSAIAQALAKEGGKPSWDFLWGQLPGLHRLFESRCDTGMACSLV